MGLVQEFSLVRETFMPKFLNSQICSENYENVGCLSWNITWDLGWTTPAEVVRSQVIKPHAVLWQEAAFLPTHSFFKYRKYFHISSSWSLFEAKSCIFQIRTEAVLGKATLEQTMGPSSPRQCLQQRPCSPLRKRYPKAHRALSRGNLCFTPRVRVWLSLQSL